MSNHPILEDTEDRFKKSIDHLKHQLLGVRTGRASAALVENIRVDYYGTPTPINQLGAIQVPEPRLIVIKPFDASIVKEMAKAITKADIGGTPQDDGKVLRLELPALSGEQRKKFAAKVKELCEETRVALRNGRRDSNKAADAAHKDGDLTEDENRKLHDDIQAALKEYEGQVDAIFDKKTKEVLDV